MSTTGEELLREVYAVSYRRLVTQLYAVCGDQHAAEDAVQDAFVKAVARQREVVSLANPEAWLRTVAINHVRSGWRRASLYRRIVHRLPGVGHEVELGPDHVAIVSALDALPQQLRDVVALYYFGDLPVAEVAQTLSIPEGTVKTRLAKARAELAELLSDEEHDHA